MPVSIFSLRAGSALSAPTWHVGWSTWTLTSSWLTRYCPDMAATAAISAEIEERLRVNIADIRTQWSMNFLVQAQDYLFNLAGQVSHLDSMSRPCYRP